MEDEIFKGVPAGRCQGINILELSDEERDALEERWLAELMAFMGY